MKSALNLDQWANPKSAPEYLLKQMKFKPLRNRRTGKIAPAPYYPKGTVYEGEEAVLRCKTGQAHPIDDECKEALGWSDAQVKAKGIEYEMDAKGIHDEGDRELYRSGVILGYRRIGDGKLTYEPGPNWDAYQACKVEADALNDELSQGTTETVADVSTDQETIDSQEVPTEAGG